MSNISKNEQTSTPDKYPQKYFKQKPCKMCKVEFSPNAPSEHYCSDECKDKALRDAYLFRTYGISLQNYEELCKAQDNKCKICNSDGVLRGSFNNSTPLVVDHCHTTGKVRGLLCHTCNSALGQFNDSVSTLEKAIEYLTQQPLELVPTERDRVRRDRATDISSTTVLNVLVDRLDNKLTRKVLMDKYKLSEAKIKGIIELKTQQAKKAHKVYLKVKESATTIENQEIELVE
jgi:hypothetical protein